VRVVEDVAALDEDQPGRGAIGELPPSLRRLTEPPRTWRDRLEQATGGVVTWSTAGGLRRSPILVGAVIVVVGLAVGGAWALLGRHGSAVGGRDAALELPMASRSPGTSARSSPSASSSVSGRDPVDPSATTSGDGPPSAGGSSPGPPGTRDVDGEIVVAAAGAVARPGVYDVPRGARVGDVVAAAGGTDAAADLDRVNLAAPVQDGERVYVPRRDQPAVPPVDTGGSAPAPRSTSGGAGPSTTAPAPVDLNTADVDQLDTLPGVGPSTAAAIVAYRSAHGRFRSVDDLGEVRGIGPAKLEQLRPLVTVG
jgi:competence protein ComEA